ncbi:MAG: PqqC-like protein [Candidatus Heimdallarchaeota archaeon LC_3]|nr:MAG: PqqC-like protein [Candidatus Heimdallarchaeota archaeon LC_3]
MKSLIIKIDNLIEEMSLLNHPFYVEWSAGKLSLDSLNGYSQEYYHLVKAVPSFVDSIMEHCPESIKEELVSLKNEEVEHIDPWIKFASELGVAQNQIKSYSGLGKTRKAIEEISPLMTSFEGGAAAMYALEQEVPKISSTKIEGLKEFYGLSSDDALDYFKIHTEADIRHADTWRKILEETPIEKEEELFEIAKKSLMAHSMILDACYEEYC